MALAPYNTTHSRLGATETTNHTFSHDNGSGSDRALFVNVQWFRNVTITGITCGGVALAQAKLSASSYDAAIWHLENPPSGTNTISITFSGNTGGTASAITFTGANQTTPVGATNSATGTSNSPSTSLTTTVADSYIIDSIYRNNSQTATAGGSQIEYQDNTDLAFGTEGGMSSYLSAPTVTSYNMSWSWSTSTEWSHALVEVLPANGESFVPRVAFI